MPVHRRPRETRVRNQVSSFRANDSAHHGYGREGPAASTCSMQAALVGSMYIVTLGQQTSRYMTVPVTDVSQRGNLRARGRGVVSQITFCGGSWRSTYSESDSFWVTGAAVSCTQTVLVFTNSWIPCATAPVRNPLCLPRRTAPAGPRPPWR